MLDFNEKMSDGYISITSDKFQKKLISVYMDLPEIIGIADDMIVYGRAELKHNKNLIWFLESTREDGLFLNKEQI